MQLICLTFPAVQCQLNALIPHGVIRRRIAAEDCLAFIHTFSGHAGSASLSSLDLGQGLLGQELMQKTCRKTASEAILICGSPSLCLVQSD